VFAGTCIREPVQCRIRTRIYVNAALRRVQVQYMYIDVFRRCLYKFFKYINTTYKISVSPSYGYSAPPAMWDHTVLSATCRR